jgi:hypothetical protein
MFKILINHLRNKREAERYKDGYRWAAGELLRHRTEEAEDSVLYSIDVSTFNSFDDGVQAALADYNKMKSGVMK